MLKGSNFSFSWFKINGGIRTGLKFRNVVDWRSFKYSELQRHNVDGSIVELDVGNPVFQGDTIEQLVLARRFSLLR